MEKIGSFFMAGMMLFVGLSATVGWVLSKEHYLTAETRAVQETLSEMSEKQQRRVITILLSYEKK